MEIQGNSQKPFLMRFARNVDLETHAEALAAADILGETYDPESQTSSYGIYAGTRQTIERTMTDWSIRRDDTRTTDD